jgi:hypothetical protein
MILNKIRGVVAMPYEKHNVHLDCDEIECKNNEDEECICDEDVYDLDPNNSARCFMYSTFFVNGAQFPFNTVKKLEKFVDDHECIAPRVLYDRDALHLVYVSLKCPVKNTSHDHKALVQISKEDVNRIEFKPSIDGSVLVVPKAQMDLIEIAF